MKKIEEGRKQVNMEKWDGLWRGDVETSMERGNEASISIEGENAGLVCREQKGGRSNREASAYQKSTCRFYSAHCGWGQCWCKSSQTKRAVMIKKMVGLYWIYT